ncbi:MAG TPA: nucleotidyltransferase [Gaiellaceae bacterium]|nr:nucleotidyltransferase [Gaiellaceae bacterium]
METLPDQFKGALARIELTEKRERVVAAQEEIRHCLEEDEQLCTWGVATVLIGSYARHTAIYPGKDVDVFTKLTKLDTSADPNAVFEAVLRVLVAKYGNQAEAQARSIKVTFPIDGEEDFAVDVVPAVRMGTRWAIPRRDRDLWKSPDAGERWRETDPEKLTALTVELNSKLKVDGQGAYVPIVKLVRQTRRHHRDDRKPGGFYFELMTYWTFVADVKGDSFAELLAATLRSLATQLENSTPLTDPVLDKPYKPEPDPDDRAEAAAVFEDLASKAELALTVARCPAAALWREILGENERGPCFPLPPGCDEKGNAIKNVAAVAAVGSEEASGFA